MTEKKEKRIKKENNVVLMATNSVASVGIGIKLNPAQIGNGKIKIYTDCRISLSVDG